MSKHNEGGKEKKSLK